MICSVMCLWSVWLTESIILSGLPGFKQHTIRIFAPSSIKDGLILFPVSVWSPVVCRSKFTLAVWPIETLMHCVHSYRLSSLCSVFLDYLCWNCDITSSIGAECTAVSPNRGLTWLYPYLTVQSAHSGSIVDWKHFRRGPSSRSQTHFQYCFVDILDVLQLHKRLFLVNVVTDAVFYCF